MEISVHSDSSQLPEIVHVACAIIEGPAGVLCALRSASMSLPLVWEFPGGKIEPGERPMDTLKREISEELSISVEIVTALQASDHAYVSERIIRLFPFICRIEGDALPVPREHAEIRWIRKEDLRMLDWAAADIPVLEHYLNIEQ